MIEGFASHGDGDDIDDREAVTVFLIESVKDIQGTIRAIDTKVSILLAALSVTIGSIVSFFDSFHRPGGHPQPQTTLAIAAIVAFAVAVAVSIRALSGIGNALEHIEGAVEHSTFYAGGLFRFSVVDALFGRRGVRARRTLQEYVAAMPTSFETVRVELTSEIMCLAYIRDLKLYRQRIAFAVTSAAAVLALLAAIL